LLSLQVIKSSTITTIKQSASAPSEEGDPAISRAAMDFLFPLHQYLAEHYEEVKLELEQMAIETEWKELPGFSLWLEKLSRQSPEGSVAHKPEVARLRYYVLQGLLFYSKDFPSGSRLRGMLEVDCPFDAEAFEAFMELKLCFNYRMPPAEVQLKEGERLLSRISEDTITFRREQYFKLSNTTEVTAEFSASLTRTIEPGSLGKVIHGVVGVLKEAWQKLLEVVDKPEQWTHHAPSPKRQAMLKAQEDVQKVVSGISPELVQFLKQNPQLWYHALDNIPVAAD
jgi:hypothetical protein